VKNQTSSSTTGLLPRIKASLENESKKKAALSVQVRAAKECVRAFLGEEGWKAFCQAVWEDEIQSAVRVTLGPSPSSPPPSFAAQAIKRKFRSREGESS
jgi:hypothetical protein